MIGVLIVTHGNFGKEILKSTELIIGKQKNVVALGLNYGDSIEEFIKVVKENIEKLNSGDGVVVFVDLFGASPYNAAAFTAKNMIKEDFRCITGVNLPMILQAFTLRDKCTLEELVDSCLNEGKSGIKELFYEMKL